MQMNEAQKYILVSRYARWLEEEGRREASWTEVSNRYFKFFEDRFKEVVPEKIWDSARKRVRALDVVGSMRAAWGAGDALAGNNIIGYNCCYLPFVDLQAVVELFYILMCGTGVGLSVEDQYISQMPEIKPQTGAGLGVHVVGDSREGWATSLKIGLEAWFNGLDVEFDYTQIRPRGARLKTMGGRASGPDPLKKLHEFVRNTIMEAQGRKLTSIEWLDVANMIGEVVVVGGVRRSSEITFSDLDDEDLRYAKQIPYPVHRKNSNNSAVYKVKPDAVTFMKEWAALAASGTGERGIYNLSGVVQSLPERRRKLAEGRTEWYVQPEHYRTNPCGEIILRPFSFCNLTEVVVRAKDKFQDLIEKVRVAVWLGAMQSTLTDFPFIRPEFKKNCEEERLLGVSLTGQMDNPGLMTEEKLAILKEYVLKEAEIAAAMLGINFSAAITTGKPSGTLSQLVDAASGAHPRHARFYIRRYRIAATDPLFRMMRDQGIHFDPEIGEGPEAVEERRKELIEKFGRDECEAKLLVPDWNEDQVNTWVCGFPIAAPKNAITRDQVTAIDQLEWYLKVKKNWCEHNQSITVYVRDEEWLKVGAWVYDHFDDLSGVSFLPYDGGKYKLAPYEEITEEEYKALAKTFPKIDYTQLSRYELEDNTTGAQQYACVGGACELA